MQGKQRSQRIRGARRGAGWDARPVEVLPPEGLGVWDCMQHMPNLHTKIIPAKICRLNICAGNSLWSWQFHTLKLRFCLSQSLWNSESQYGDWPYRTSDARKPIWLNSAYATHLSSYRTHHALISNHVATYYHTDAYIWTYDMHLHKRWWDKVTFQTYVGVCHITYAAWRY